MKTAVEKYTIRTMIWPEKTFAIHRETLPYDKLSDFFKKNYDAIYQELAKQDVYPKEPPCAFYYRVDEVKKETDLAAAVPLNSPAKPSALFEVFRLPPTQVVTTKHVGPYEDMVPAYQQLEDYLNENNLQKGLVIEEYLTDPLVQKDPAKWQTNIYFVVTTK